MIYLICVLLIILVICGIACGIHFERVKFNNGICPKCGKPLKFFDMDSQGGRGYCCNDCRYFVWVSYDCVDKNYKEKSVMKLWIARDGDGALFLFSVKPIKENNYWYEHSGYGYCFTEIPNDVFPEITFENSPQQVEIKLI